MIVLNLMVNKLSWCLKKMSILDSKVTREQ